MNAFPFPRGRFPRIGIDEVVVADTETTGLFPLGVDDDGAPCAGEWGPDRLCSLATVRLRAVGGAWEMGDVVQWLVDPGRPVPEVAARINGFAWSGDGAPVPAGRVDLFGRPSFAEIAEEFLSFVGDASLVCHNIVFDVAVLDAELVRAGMSPLRGPVLCTKKAYSDIQGLGRPNRYVAGTNLNKLCDALGVDRSSRVGPDGEELHGAAVDARLAARCFALLEPQGWIEIEDPASLPHRRFLMGSVGAGRPIEEGSKAAHGAAGMSSRTAPRAGPMERYPRWKAHSSMDSD